MIQWLKEKYLYVVFVFLLLALVIVCFVIGCSLNSDKEKIQEVAEVSRQESLASRQPAESVPDDEVAEEYIDDYEKTKRNREVDKANIKGYVSDLTQEKFEGRRAGTRGEAEAGLYLATKLKEMEIEPFFGETYFQNFEIPGMEVIKRGKRYVFKTNNRMPGAYADNIVGIVRTAEKNNNDYIIVCAHYDHLGKLGSKVFNGANDNASGVASVLEIARVLNTRKSELPSSVIVAFWTGEEMGMLGSKYFVENMSIPCNRIKMVINIDSVGSYGNKDFVVWKEDDKSDFMLEEFKKWKSTSVTQGDRTGHNSDHFYFSQKNIPAVTFLSKDWLEGNHTTLDNKYGVSSSNIALITQYIVNYIYSLKGSF